MKSTILLVDDEENILNSLLRALSNDDYNILTANSAAEALETLKTEDVQVIISDQRMPNMTGSELLKKVKEEYPNVITMILSGYADFDAVKEAINNGHIYKFLSKPWDNAFLREQVREAIIQFQVRMSMETEREKLLFWDKLTGLYNRVSFMNELAGVTETARKNQSLVAIVLIDLDRFGNINNRFGQHIGNQILQAVSARLKEWAGDERTIARIGNDEFAILLNDVSQLNQIKLTVQDLDAALKKPFTISEREVYITSSIGVSLYPQDCDRYDMLIEKAHIALNMCKEIGGGLYQFYDTAMEKEADINLLLETEIHRALDEDQFINLYQPIVSLETGEIVGVETLLRWNHPRRGLLSPAQFLPICEMSGLIIPIDTSVLRKAIDDLKYFIKSGLTDLYITSNFSTRHFMSHGLTELVAGMIELTEIEPHKVIIEVTESLLVQNSDMVQIALQNLHNLGVRLALDDFGTGYASLSYLKKYPFDILKIDKSYTREIGHSKNDEVLVSAMINMAKSLGQKVVAEGIESQRQVDFLKEKECEFGQGFMFSQPVTREELIKKLTSEEFTKSIKQRMA